MKFLKSKKIPETCHIVILKILLLSKASTIKDYGRV